MPLRAKIITASEAEALLSDSNAQALPWACLNESGREMVKQWIEKHAKEPAKQILRVWVCEAERAVNDGAIGAVAQIVMPARVTSCGNPQTLSIGPSAIDWTLQTPE